MTQEADYWFKPRSYGYGATPINWKGWVVGGAYVAAIWAFAFGVLLSIGDRVTWVDMVIWFGGIAAITIPFLWLCRAKTDGKWRWNWGDK
jgi:hypothetical protein